MAKGITLVGKSKSTVQFKRLKLVQFRNYHSEELSFSHRIVGIGGPNGAGKTSVLDAIHFLTVTRGLVSSTDRSYVKKGTDFFRLEGGFYIEGEAYELAVKYQPGKGKTIEIDGEKVKKLSDFIGKFPVVSMIPQDIDNLLAGSRERRRVLDLGFSQIDKRYLDHLLVYRKLLRQRNAYLKESLKNGQFETRMMDTFDERIAPYARALFQLRTEYTAELGSYFNEFYREISGGKEEISLEYQSQLAGGDYLDLVRKNRERDRVMGRSHVGLHKDDLAMSLLAEKLRDVASQGQLKSGVLSLKLALHRLIVSHTQKQPVFLIDDLFDRLDEKRAGAFLRVTKEQTEGQIFITDTNIKRLRQSVAGMNEKFTIFSIDKGKVLEVTD